MDISKITDYLYVSSKLHAEHFEELKTRNISLAISMIVGQVPPQDSSFRILWLQTCDSILIPIPLKELKHGVHAALTAIKNGQSVLVYCAKGRHRSIAMASAILIAMGYTARESMNLLQEQRAVADPHRWHIERRIYKFEKYWQNKSTKQNNLISRIEEKYSENATSFISSLFLMFKSSKVES